MTVTGPYAPAPGFYDEALDQDGRPRAHGGAALAALAGADVGELKEAIRADLAARGIDYQAEGGAGEFLLDPVPRVLGAEEWERLAAGLVQRVRALNAFLADTYGPRRAVAEGVVPARVIDSSESYEPRMRGVRPHGDMWVGIAGLDVVRDGDGELVVLEDNLRTPSGFAYAVEARSTLLAHLDADLERAPLPVDDVPAMLAATMRAASPAAEPSMVVLTDGPENSAAYEHAWAARRLGAPLVEPRDLELRGDRLLHEGRPVDVVYRRTDMDELDSEAGALLEPPLRAGTLGVVNAFGTGVADDKLAHAYVEDMIRFHLGEEPLLRSVETLDLGRPEELERALDELETLVVKPRRGHGGAGVVVCPHADPVDVERIRTALRTAPEEYVAQPTIEISLHPTVIDGELCPRHVDLRPFVFMRGAGEEAAVMPGGLTRVALDDGSMVVNSTQNGGAKDTWVLP